MSILFLGFIFSCGKQIPEQELPAVTSSGKHTLGFYLNDEAWIPYDKGNRKMFELPQPTLTESGGVKISATRIDRKQHARNWFCIEIEKDCFSKGRYAIGSQFCTSPYQVFYYGTNKEKASEVYMIDTLRPHFIDIHYLSKKKKIIAGTFEFDAITENGDRLEIRSGRFDLKLK